VRVAPKASPSQPLLLGNGQGRQPGGTGKGNHSRAELPRVENLSQFHPDDLRYKEYSVVLQQGGLEMNSVLREGLAKAVWGS